jgi:hypothetical protein
MLTDIHAFRVERENERKQERDRERETTELERDK